MNKTLNYLKTLILFVAVFSVYSCIPNKKLVYIQDPTGGHQTYQQSLSFDNGIRPGDELYIRVSSFDDISYNFFSSQTSTNYMNYGSEASIALISYTVSDSGYIDFPIIGHIFLKDLTLDDATVKMKKILGEYFNQPTVLIRLVNKRVTVIGEVSHPGTYIYTKDHLNIMEALALAGDATIHGNKEKVYLLRQAEGVITKTELNMTKDDLLLSEMFAVRSNDIIYVSPRKSLKWNVIATPINLALSSITTALVVYSIFR